VAFIPHALADDPIVGSPLVSGSLCSGAGTPITGSGASFAANAYNQVFIPAYAARCGGSASYTGGGSGKGRRDFINRVNDWGQTDEPLTLDEYACATGDLGWNAGTPSACAATPGLRPGGGVHQIPVAVGAVTVSYNLPCASSQLNLHSEQIALIFSGVIKDWSDPLLLSAADNPGLAGCSGPITLAVRSDVSGTTYVFKDYLSKRNPQFMAYKQSALNTQWPAEDSGLNPSVVRGIGNGGVAAQVSSHPGSIGYVELSSAASNGLTWAKVDGPSGFTVAPDNGTAANCDLAAIGAATPPTTLYPDWSNVSITDTANPLAYPICSLTYALIYDNQHLAYNGAHDGGKARAVVDLLGIALTNDAQAALGAFHYSALPISILQISRLGLATVTDLA
jgi:phosphate transport system substrate-binding protein